MRGIWGLLPKVGALVLAFGGTVGAVDEFRCHDSFSTVCIDSQLDSRATAYVKIVRQTKAFFRHGDNDPARLRALSHEWIMGSRSGKLQQIYPGYCGETLVEGPKGDIFTSCAGLANRLSERAEAEDRVNDPKAAEDAILALELINIVRYGSCETLFTAGSYLRRPVKVLKKNLKTLSPSLLARLRVIEDPKVRTYRTQLLSQVAKRQKTQYAARYGDEMAKQDENNYSFFLAANRRHIAANHFYGFDRENSLQRVASK